MQNISENTESPSSSSNFSEFKNLFNCVSALELETNLREVSRRTPLLVDSGNYSFHI